MNEGLSGVEGVRVPDPPADGTHVYQLYTVEFDPGIDRSVVIETLEGHGVSSKIYWDAPVHRTAYYEETTDGPAPDLPTTSSVVDRVLSLPVYPGLSPAATDRIVAAVGEGIERAR